MDHTNHHKVELPTPSHTLEYVKLTGVFIIIVSLAWLHAHWQGMAVMQFLESFMGMFFLIFASFKLVNLKEFAYGLKSYVGFEDKPISWGYAYPFFQLAFAALYLFGFGNRAVDGAALIWSAYGAYIVWQTLRKKGDFHCVCLGNVIKLPLSTISFIEDFSMAAMAAVMFILR